MREFELISGQRCSLMMQEFVCISLGISVWQTVEKRRKGVRPKLELTRVSLFEVLTSSPNRTYQLKDYKDVVNKN